MINWGSRGKNSVRISYPPDPAAPTGTIEVVDCAAKKLVGFGGTLVVNDNEWCEVPTRETSWGQLKALYR